MPLIDLPPKQLPPETELARRYWSFLRDNRKTLPASTPLPATFPSKTWSQKFKRLTKVVGEAAVKQMLDRLIAQWAKLSVDGRPSNAGLFCSPNYFQHVLPKLLAKAVATKPVKLPPALKTDWDQIRDLHWPGDKEQVKAALVRTNDALLVIWKRLRRLRKKQNTPVTDPHTGYTTYPTPAPWESVGIRMYERLDQMRAGDLMSQLFGAISSFGDKIRPDYAGPKYTLTTDAPDKHMIVGKLFGSTESGRKLLEYLKGGDE